MTQENLKDRLFSFTIKEHYFFCAGSTELKLLIQEVQREYINEIQPVIIPELDGIWIFDGFTVTLDYRISGNKIDGFKLWQMEESAKETLKNLI